MARDLAIHTHTGDLVFASNMDLQVVEAEDVMHQRIYVRLMVERGEWIYDTDGTLGSDTRRTLHLPRFRAIGETELVIRHALEPMQDIQITSIHVEEDVEDAQRLRVTIMYIPTDVDEEDLGDFTGMEQTVEVSLDSL